MDFKISWKDPRLTFKNLKENTEDNEATDFDQRIWVPLFTITGPHSASCDIVPRFSIFSIEKQSQPLPDDDSFINEGNTIHNEYEYKLTSLISYRL